MSHRELRLCVVCTADDKLDRLDYTQDVIYEICGLCLNTLLDERTEKQEALSRVKQRIQKLKTEMVIEKPVLKFNDGSGIIGSARKVTTQVELISRNNVLEILMEELG